MNMNLDQNLVPQYGAGQFWNPYNVNLRLDTLALVGALVEWGHGTEALRYLGWFLRENIDNNTGRIDYKNFGCDSDADYGRLIDLFVAAVRYSSNMTWAQEHVHTIHMMTRTLLAQRVRALVAYPQGHPLHGIIPGSP